ncbi:ankyrin repeat-containing domain protein [Bombardia bombarda]|uniref:Ankyrin repeat-containing domain protein n=1 Tax=Bombardia bombarda TaxID=252184 RepID=A0AA39WZM7_9PEZI|nr:ankyrin repeat-containing domain protein [Bombardia bombarda]
MRALKDHRSVSTCCHLKLFLDHPALDLNIKDDAGFTALHMAVTGENLEAVRDLAPRCGEGTNFKDVRGKTALVVAAEAAERVGDCTCEATAMVEALLCVDKIDASLGDDHEMTPLHYAASRGDFNMCRLLAARVDGGILAKCAVGKTPLEYAKDGEVAALLLGFQRKAEAMRARYASSEGEPMEY